MFVTDLRVSTSLDQTAARTDGDGLLHPVLRGGGSRKGFQTPIFLVRPEDSKQHRAVLFFVGDLARQHRFIVMCTIVIADMLSAVPCPPLFQKFHSMPTYVR